MFTFNVLFGGFIVMLLYYMWTRRRFYYLTWQIGGPIGYPFIGLALSIYNPAKVLYTMLEYKQKYGHVFVAWVGPTAFLVVTDPELSQTILTSPDCVNKSTLYEAIKDGTGNGLFCSKNPDWSIHRKLLNPTFSQKVLLSFFPIFNREADNMQIELSKLVNSGEFNISSFLQKLTLRITSQTTMDQVTDADGNQYKDLLDCYKCVLKTVTKMVCLPLLRNTTVLKMTDLYQPYMESKRKIRSFTIGQVEHKLLQRKKEPHQQTFLDTHQEDFGIKSPKIFIDRAIELFQNGDFTWQDVEDESNQIIFGAFNTTSNTIGYTLMMLSMFPNYQNKLYEEIKSIIPSKDSNIDVTYEDIKEMTYMDMVLNETMRIMAPVPVIGRETVKDVTLPNGVVLPQGMQVIIDIFNMHRDPEYWGPDSNTFNPDNFLPENMANKHPYTFIPFTKGIRNCIGWKYALFSSKIILSKLLRKYRFSTKFDFQDLKFVEDITIELQKSPLLEIHLRES